MSRKFGVELEMTGITREQAVRALNQVGVSVQNESYNHVTRAHWKIVPDGSVSGGFEVVSPVLEGEAGLEQLRTVVTALDDMGGKVDRRCGYHVHFDAADLSVEHIRAIVLRYAAFEAEIDAFMPPSRRGSANTYCQSVRDLARSERFLSATTLQALTAAQRGRYFKVNLQAYHAHGTVEFRQHSGTLNAPKAVNWVRLLEAFVAETKARADAPVVVAAPVPPVPTGHLQGVLAQLADMFRQGEVSLQAMVERFNWQPHTARAAVSRLRRAGLNIVCPRHGGNVYRLDGTAAPAPIASPDRIGRLWDGVADTLCTYYRNRAAVLAVAA